MGSGAQTVRSTTAMNTYGWLKSLTGMREWLGPRLIDNLSEASYTIQNKHFEKTVSVNRNNIEDDNLGMYSDGFTVMGDGAARLPEELVWGLLKAGFSTNCWDGQYFFDTDHPITLADGSLSTYANTDALRDWVGFVPGTSVKDGIARFVAWYREYYQV